MCYNTIVFSDVSNQKLVLIIREDYTLNNLTTRKKKTSNNTQPNNNLKNI